MNYRHAYHAGNAADVLKHLILANCLSHLNRKDAPWRLVDSHAGRGLYDLHSDAATRTGEWVEGIGRLWGKEFPPDLATLLAPYLEAVTSLNPDGKLRHYPGSPAIAQHFLRREDRYIGCETHPRDFASLSKAFAGDRCIKVIAQDGWLAPAAHLPPRERRGLLLIDPPYEEAQDWTRAVRALQIAQERWATGTVLLWYPVKDADMVARLQSAVHGLKIPQCLDATLITHPEATRGLYGSGMIMVNPPFWLAKVLYAASPDLLAALQSPKGWYDCVNLGTETS